MAKKLTLSQKSIGCGFMVQNHEAIYTKDVQEAVLEFEEYLKEYDLYIVGSMCPTKFKNKWGDNSENQILVMKEIFGNFPSH